MGRTPSEKPSRLAEKLIDIRRILDLSQGEMVRRLGLEYKLTREDVSKYERGLRVPPLLTLLKYAQVAGVNVDTLIDDTVDLPKKLSGRLKKDTP
jgi:transcriptional regulator with XRE-family HTH domain